VTNADEKRILTVKGERLVGFFNDNFDSGEDDAALLSFLENGKKHDLGDGKESHLDREGSIEDEPDDLVASDAPEKNYDEAKRVERLIEQSEHKRSFVMEMVTEINQNEGKEQ